jgi:DNA-binding NtrC family response regulator
MGVADGQAENLHVLIADDDPDIRDLLGEFFRERRMKMALAYDGRAAISALERTPGGFDLVVTDVGMPGADGFAVLSAARVACPDAYVAIMTGFASLETAIQTVRMGAHDYVTKPFSLGQMSVILDRALARRAAASVAPPHQERRDPALDFWLGEIEGRLSSIEQTLSQLHAHLAEGPDHRRR